MRPQKTTRAIMQVALFSIAALALPATAHADPKFKFRTLHSFSGSDGVNPSTETPMRLGRDGRLYGVVQTGGSSGNGVLFSLNPGGKFRLVHSFTGGPDGGNPTALFTDADGTVFGSTAFGGAYSYGVAFRLDAGRSITTIHEFDGIEAGMPSGSVVLKDGLFYGASGFSGSLGRGTVYSLAPSGQVSIVFDFADSTDEPNPYYGLSGSSDGSLYGVTFGALSPDQYGTVFRLDTDGSFATLHTFAGGTDGEGPTNAPVQARDGSVYGTTIIGGENGCGTIYRVDPEGTYARVHTFGGSDEGCQPFAQLVAAKNGRLYGTTAEGGAFGQGTIFEFRLDGSLRTLHHFTGGEDGGNAQPGLVETSPGTFYGMTGGGGEFGLGTIYKIRAY